jgi:type IX secretion system PorP/SprF family membrane protein
MGVSVDVTKPTRVSKKKSGSKYGSSRVKNPARLAGGLSVYRDISGDGRLGLTLANLSLASFVPMGKRSHLSMGVQGSWAQRKFDATSYVFPSQYGSTGYDPGIVSGEELLAEPATYNDLAAGILWTYGQNEKTFITHTELKFRLGASMYHVLEPSRRHLANTLEPVMTKYVTHGELIGNITPRSALAPSFLYQVQGPATELIAGIMYRHYLSNTTKYTGYVNRTVLGAGAYYRNGDAAIIALLFEWDERYALGVSYDLNISSLAATSSRRGGLEFSLRYSPPVGFLYHHR